MKITAHERNAMKKTGKRKPKIPAISEEEKERRRQVLATATTKAGSGAEVGRRIGVTTATVSNWKKGWVTIIDKRLDQLKAIIDGTLEEQGHE